LGIVFLFCFSWAAMGAGQDLDSLLDSVPENQTPVETIAPGSPGQVVTPGVTGTDSTSRLNELVAALKKYWEDIFQAVPGQDIWTNLPGQIPGPGGTGTTGPGDSEVTTPPPVGTVPPNPVSGDDLAAQAERIMAAIRAQGEVPGKGKGDSEGAEDIPGFPLWFGKLQNLLCGCRKWSADHEAGRAMLKQYADQWAAQNLPQPTFHSLTHFFGFLGCAENNDFAIASYEVRNKLPQLSVKRSGMMGGCAGAVDWCAWASNYCFITPIREAKFQTPEGNNWANNTKYFPIINRGDPGFELKPGDYISNGSHAMTIVQDRGDRILVVSGNAGGGAEDKSNVVRLEERRSSDVILVKKFSPLPLATIQANGNDLAWLKTWGLAK
jgi:hypothetical protein